MPSRMRGRGGFSLPEILVVVAIIGVAAAMAAPRFNQMQSNQDLKDVSREVGNVLLMARELAIQSGDNHIVYFATTDTKDICSRNLEVNGKAVPVLVLDDGKPGTGNCCIDAGEVVMQVPAENGVSWGVTRAGGASPVDSGRGNYTTGSSFADPAGSQARWVLFRPDGFPVAFSTACVEGQIGSGGGGVYVTNGERDYSAVLSPLGNVTVRGYDEEQTKWSD